MSAQAPDETWAEVRQMFKETAAQFQATDARLDQRFRETDEKLRRLESMFGSQWGKLIEALVQPGVLALFQKRGIDVRRLHQRSKARVNGDNMEADLIMENGMEVVVGEVKSSMGVTDVREFIADLHRFTYFFPNYAGFRIYGAVAALEFAEGADRFAYRQGLFVLGVEGQEMVTMLNDDKFRPHDFGAEQTS